MKKIILSISAIMIVGVTASQAVDQAQSKLETEGGLHMMVFHTDKDGKITPLAVLHDEENAKEHNTHAKKAATLGVFDNLYKKGSNLVGKIKQGVNDKIIDPPPSGTLNRLSWTLDRADASIERKIGRVMDGGISALPGQAIKGVQDAFNHIKKFYG
jgi:hypothetical protein